MCKSLSNTARNLRVIRESLNLTRDSFAQLIKRDGQTAKNWENGKCSPNAESMFKLALTIEHNYGVRIDLNEMITGIIDPFECPMAA